MCKTIQNKGASRKPEVWNSNPVSARQQMRIRLKARYALTIVSLIILSIFSNPIFISSQQTDFCDFSEDEMKPAPTAWQICACEQLRSKITASYEISDAVFGVKPVRKTSKSTGAGVAAARGTIERTQRTKLLGKLEIPNTDDSNSPEVAALREELRKTRENERKYVEYWWRIFSKKTSLKLVACDPPAANCPGKFVEARLPGKTQNENYRVISENYRARVFNQYYDLQNTSEWQRLPKFDWRERGLNVGQVMNQGECGSCWAFASVSVYQSAWELEQLRMGYGVINVFHPPEWVLERKPSVQQLLNCMSEKKGDCRAGWHGSAFAFMVNDHVPHIPDNLMLNKPIQAEIEEYTGRKSVCNSAFKNRVVRRGGNHHVIPLENKGSTPTPMKNSDSFMTAFDRALAWGYVNDPFDEMPSVEKLKAALIEHGPLAVSIFSDSCFSLYKSGVFNGRSNRSVNHVVVLIGWDDEKKAWLIKNSWGENWGEKGFAWVEYESNNIGLFAAWIQPSPLKR